MSMALTLVFLASHQLVVVGVQVQAHQLPHHQAVLVVVALTLQLLVAQVIHQALRRHKGIMAQQQHLLHLVQVAVAHQRLAQIRVVLLAGLVAQERRT